MYTQTRQLSINNYSDLMLDSTSARPTPPIHSHRRRMRWSSAAASAGWPRRFGSARGAIASPCSRSSMRRAAAPTSTVRTASPSMPGRPSSPRRSCSRSLWQLCGRRLADDVDAACRYRRSTASASTTARRSTTPATPTRCAREIARLSPGDVAGYERFMASERGRSSSVGFEQLGHVPFCSLDRHGPDRSRHDQAAQLPHGLRPRVAATSSDPRLRVVFSFHPLLIGGNPFTRDVDLLPDRLPRAALGRALRHGRHRRAGRRAWSA